MYFSVSVCLIVRETWKMLHISIIIVRVGFWSVNFFIRCRSLFHLQCSQRNKCEKIQKYTEREWEKKRERERDKSDPSASLRRNNCFEFAVLVLLLHPLREPVTSIRKNKKIQCSLRDIDRNPWRRSITSAHTSYNNNDSKEIEIYSCSDGERESFCIKYYSKERECAKQIEIMFVTGNRRWKVEHFRLITGADETKSDSRTTKQNKTSKRYLLNARMVSGTMETKALLTLKMRPTLVRINSH